jgi:hypothetical protein
LASVVVSLWRARRIEFVKRAALLRLCSTSNKALLFTDRFADRAQLNHFLRGTAGASMPATLCANDATVLREIDSNFLRTWRRFASNASVVQARSLSI